MPEVEALLDGLSNEETLGNEVDASDGRDGCREVSDRPVHVDDHEGRQLDIQASPEPEPVFLFAPDKDPAANPPKPADGEGKS
jgi:hypothetical protein